jgi:hypothetical protein
LSGDWGLKQTAAMLRPSVTIKRGGRRWGCAGAICGRRATERAVNAVGVVIVLVFVQLPCQVHGIPEEYAVKILTPDRSDEPFDKRMRDGSVWDRLDLFDLDHALVGEPTVKAEERIMIGTEIFRFTLPGGGCIEHAAHRHAINACGGDAKAEDTTGEGVPQRHGKELIMS